MLPSSVPGIEGMDLCQIQECPLLLRENLRKSRFLLACLPLRPHFDQPVSVDNGNQVGLNYDDSRASLCEVIKDRKRPINIGHVQTRSRLIENTHITFFG